MNTIVLIVTHAVAVAAGAFGWPHVQTLVASFKASRAVTTAKALVAKAEADAAALAAAKAVVAAQPKPGATGPTGA
jgi:hypothetical protein